MIFINAVVLNDLVGALADSGRSRIGGPWTILAVLVPQDPDNKPNHLGLGGKILDTPGEDDVAGSDGRDAGLIFAAQSQVNFPGSTDVGNKVIGGGVGGNHLGCLPVTNREGCAHSPRLKVRGGPKILGSAVNPEEKVPSLTDGDLIFEDMVSVGWQMI